ncbi:small heat shock protein, chloroplastic-like [Papaver somniferum]|uniref:small heat shock protein, chloroplastic-like n=1 Tax=Papaver somniferum TaxID=3469 RepID=UPI000E6F9630|nr:small heat shock protein, chloroplastic-like [Papaver somniferum]
MASFLITCLSAIARKPPSMTPVFPNTTKSTVMSSTDLLDAIETESGYDSEEEVEVEEEENLMERWTAREIEEGAELKINMPGLCKEDVHVTLEETTLLIKAGKADENENPVVVVNGDKTDEENDMMMNTMISFELDLDFLKLDEMKAEMKNGVLKIFIPKIMEEKKEKLVMEIKVE